MLESRLLGEISITSDMQMTPPLWQKVKRNYGASWWRWKRRVKKVVLKLNIQKTHGIHSKNIHGIWSHHFLTNRYWNSERLYSFGLQIPADDDCSHEIKRCFLLKNRDTTLLTNVHILKATVFPIVMNGCESWTLKKAERWRIDSFKLWCWRRLLRVPWTAQRSNQSVLK